MEHTLVITEGQMMSSANPACSLLRDSFSSPASRKRHNYGIPHDDDDGISLSHLERLGGLSSQSGLSSLLPSLQPTKVKC